MPPTISVGNLVLVAGTGIGTGSSPIEVEEGHQLQAVDAVSGPIDLQPNGLALEAIDSTISTDAAQSTAPAT